jgi:beta-glucosidase
MEQPGSTYFGDALKQAIAKGEIPMWRLDDMVKRILGAQFATGQFDLNTQRKVVDVFKGLEVAQKVAERGTVLLKNANSQLPLSKSLKSIAIIGSHADVGVLSGGGSGQVDPPGGSAVPAPSSPEAGPMAGFGRVMWFPSSPMKAILAKVRGAKVQFDEGSDPAKAAALAKSSDVAIVFVSQHTSEGRDFDLTLPDGQDKLVEAVSAANPKTIVVLETGGPVHMPWRTE